MVRAENKYKARLLDEQNVWGNPTEEQEKIVAMSAEINFLKKEQGGTSGKTNKPKQAAKKQAQKKQHPRNPRIRRKIPMTSGLGKRRPQKNWMPKKMLLFVKTFETKKFFWCKNHNNGAGMWTLHHPNEWESGSRSNKTTTNANLAAFDTVDSNSK